MDIDKVQGGDDGQSVHLLKRGLDADVDMERHQHQQQVIHPTNPVAPGTYCMELRTVQSTAFKLMIEALKEMLTDTTIDFDETGMKIMATDTTRVVLVHVFLEAGKFEYYHCPQKISIGVNMMNLHKFVRAVTNNDTLTLYIDSNDINHLGIKVENGDKNSKTHNKLMLLDLGDNPIFADPMQYNSVITLPSVDFQKICRDMANLSAFMEIKDVQNQLIFSCHGDFGSQETILCDNDTNMYSIGQKKNAHEIVQGVFALKHLVQFTKCTNLCNTVELMLRNDFPLLIRYGVASLGEIKLCLAPVERDNAPTSSAPAPFGTHG
jgi:proliferating cell nuclear antigen